MTEFPDPRASALLARLASVPERPAAAAALAAHLDVEAFLVLVRDPDLGTLVPAPGFLQTFPGGPTWRAFIDACGDARTPVGSHRAEVAFPDAAARRAASAFVIAEDGTAFVFIEKGGIAATRDLAAALDRFALPILGALFRAELAAVIARGRVDAERESARQAHALTAALDRTRADLEKAVSQQKEARRLAEDAQKLLAAVVAERKQADDDRQRLLGESEAANRAKDEFLAMLGHELRNPLAPIATAVQLLKLRAGDHPAREHQIIERQVSHLTRLVDDLLDVSRITRGKVQIKKEPIDLSGVITRAVEMASPLLEQRRHHFSISVPATGMRLAGDEGRLAQVVSNLLTNAARYTPPGGEIAVSAERVVDEIVLSVRDNGIGIDADMLPHIFDMFTQGKRAIDRAEGGLGLGLALVKNLVAMHGGTVSAYSAGRDRGSEFVVCLPALPMERASGPHPTAQPPIEVKPRLASKRILVVDDNVDGAELLSEFLSGNGYQVTTAHDGPIALDLAARSAPEVAVLDIGLPVMDGYELAQRLRKIPGGRTMRLIALTGYGQDADRARTHAAGFDVHLVKPVDLTKLLDAIAVHAAK